MGSDKGVVKVLLDTNTLILATKLGMNIFKAVEDALLFKCSFYILDETLEEIERLKEKSSSYNVRVLNRALNYAKRCNVLKYKRILGENVDDLILRVAYENKPIIVITNDQELRSRLKRLGVTVGYIDIKAKIVKVLGFWT